jgi:hypothetical protein
MQLRARQVLAQRMEVRAERVGPREGAVLRIIAAIDRRHPAASNVVLARVGVRPRVGGAFDDLDLARRAVELFGGVIAEHPWLA